MTRARVLLAALLFTLACDKQKPQRMRVPKPQRLAVPKRGLPIAGDPLPAPQLALLFRAARLVPIVDGGGSVWQGVAEPGIAQWMGPFVDRTSDGASGRTALAIRRAAFGQHVPAAGEKAEIDDEVLIDAGYADEQRLVVLFGPETQCIAMKARARVIAENAGGHRLDVRWPLDGCGAGPWAPFGLVANRQPSQLRWRIAQCPEPEPIASAWTAARPADVDPASWIELGALVIGDEPHILVAWHDGRGVLLLAPTAESAGWTRLEFDPVDMLPVRNGCPPPEPAPAEAAPGPAETTG